MIKKATIKFLYGVISYLETTPKEKPKELNLDPSHQKMIDEFLLSPQLTEHEALH